MKREAGRGRQRPGRVGGDGKRWAWRAEMDDVGRGTDAGRKQYQRSQQRQREEESSWRILSVDEEL